MADRLYLSLWYPNFRLEFLPAALTGVLRQFAVLGQKRVSAASAYPINFTEAPTYQRIYVNTASASEDNTLAPGTAPLTTADATGSALEAAVAEATEQLHDDMAYEFEMRWQLWSPEQPGGSAHHAGIDYEADADLDDETTTRDPGSELDTLWRLGPHTVRILGFGPAFDVAGYEQNGHILIDFGLDTPWVLDTTTETGPNQISETQPLDQTAQLHIQQNIEKLLAFTLLVEKNCGISSRLLWTESGEPLAEKLIARLQRVN